TSGCYRPGLRQNVTDRSNVAVQDAGTADDDNVTLRLTVFSGSSQAPGSITLPDVTLPPGGFKQFNSILATSGLAAAQGYVRVERGSGQAPFYDYAVVNDHVTYD